MPVSSSERLRRLLALVPYVINRSSVSVEEAAAAFGVTEKQIIDDLNLLWCVELRAPDPYCPIDLSYEGGEIVVCEAESISRPLRLDVDEAAALLVALRTIAEIPEHGDAVSQVIAKLEVAAGTAARPSSQVAVQLDVRPDVLVQVQSGLDQDRRLRMTYYVPGRDENTVRDVDPMRLLIVDGWSYLEGWCRRAEAVRLFRLDRIVDLQVLDVTARIPDEAEPLDLDAGLFRPSPEDVRVTFELSAAGRWVADHYPCESIAELGEGRVRVVLRTRDVRWVRRLALRLAGTGRIVEPAELAAQVREDAARALKLYDA
ncbi:WYL domain-containing protein [Actinoallomurus purpureus]|uniref:helix-turn-helix transcriptional regulator n=1 Tax=Actinoallomurus purpureus TaxID=478114 RepID=UPI0020933943|nr:WYL domain-containing protein [Actinoallomurus purpureus]MCO6007761.1 WYL domain-containing protein [Actinoallomurus purpureus]